jgi:hypothetical protein
MMPERGAVFGRQPDAFPAIGGKGRGCKFVQAPEHRMPPGSFWRWQPMRMDRGCLIYIKTGCVTSP